jgi:hypothetical protein
MESHILEHIALLAAEQVEQEMMKETQQVTQMMQQAQQNPQMAQQAQMAQQQLMEQKESRIAAVEAELVQKMLEEERRRTEEMADDPLVKLKQQEIDLRAMETLIKQKEEKERLKKDFTIDTERLDLDRDKLEAQIGVDLIKQQTADADLQSKEKLAALKENMSVVREQMKGKVNGTKPKKD